MARVIVNLSDININIKDKNTKYLWYRVFDESGTNYSDSSINYKVKVSSNEIPSEYITNIVQDTLRNTGT